jgi:hypothetical protein
MKTIIFLVADYANVTREGKLNVMGIFNDIHSISFPARHASMHLVAKLGAELGEWGQSRDFTVKLLDADGNQIMDVTGQFQVPKGERGRTPEVNIILELKDVVFPTPGAYQFVFLVDKDQKADLSLHLNQLEPPKPAEE